MKKHFFLLSLLISLTLGIGQMWAQAPEGTTLFSENFGSYSANNVPSGSVTTATGRVVYGNANVTYTCTDGGTTTKIYNEATGGGTAPEILISKSNGTFVIAGIPSGGAQVITVSFTQNNQALSVTPSGNGYSGSCSGKPGAVGTRTFDITVANGADATFTLTFKGTGSSNVRVDDILVTVKTAGEGAGTPTCATPTFSPAAGSYEGTQNVTISSTTGATIYYTTDGSTPNTSSSVYSSAITVSANTTIKAYAVKSDYNDSEVATATYTITAAPDVTLDFTTNTEWGFPTTKTVDEGSYTSGTYTVKVAGSSGNGYNFNSNYLFLGKTNAYIELPKFSSPVEKIVVVGTSGGSTGVKFNVFDGETAVSTEVTGCQNVSQEFEIDDPAANKTYTIKVTSNANLQVSKIKIYYGAASSKTAAGLAYTDADALVKVGASFTAPTLTNPYSLTPTYESSDASIVAVNASTGALSIKAAGKAVITASTAETDSYKAGSASYTIYVAEQAGTADDPLTEASAKAVINLGCALNAHVNGTVLSQNSTNYTVTLTDGFQFYKTKDLGNVAFTSAYLGTGDEVTAYGKLTKYNSTYELAEGCYLTFYEQATTPLTPIANTKETAYTVAQALAYAAAPTTYDLSDHVYIAGVVYDVKNFNSTNGTYDIYIKDANAENKFEFYKCAGLYEVGETAIAFAEGDVQVGDEVIGYGVMTYYSGGSIWEFGQPNQLVSLNRPTVAVTGVELASTATVKVGKTVSLSASVLPANATDKAIEWSIQSGNDKITLDNGTVTGVAEGTAVVRATSHADNTKYAQCTITIAAADPTYLYYNYEKVTATADIEDGEYLIVYEGDDTHAAVAFNSALGTYDAASNGVAVTIIDGKIASTTAIDAAAFTVETMVGGYSFKGTSGKYMGATSYSNSVATSTTAIATTISISEGNAVLGITFSGGTVTMRYNYASDQLRFRYYKSSQQAIQLYKKVGTNEAPKANPQLAWDPADDIEITVGETFTAPTLTYAQGFDGVDDIVIESDNTSLATVTAGVVSLVTDATGEATITATFAGNDNYKAAEVSYKITVNSSTPTPASGNVVILAEYNSKFYAMSTALSNSSCPAIEVEKDGDNIVVTSAVDKAAIQWSMDVNESVSPKTASFQAGDNGYLKGTSGGASLSFATTPFNWEWNETNNCYIVSGSTRGFFYKNDGVFKNYALSNLSSTSYAGVEIIAIDPANIVISSKADPELVYTPASDVITVGDAWSAPSLSYVDGFDGLAAVTYTSNNVGVATVTDAGVISLAGGIGTAIITASFAGNANYLLGSATYTIKVNDVPDNCDETDDFITATSSDQPSAYGSRATTNGWAAINAAWTTINNEQCYFTLNGKTKAVGVIQSPTLNDGIASLKIRYANLSSESNGVSFRVDIKQNDEVVKTYTVTKANSAVAQGTVYTETIEDINVEGDFVIVITNLSPSNNSTSNKDRVSIGKLCWLNYSAPVNPTPDPEYVEYRTGLEIGRYYTICLPQEITAVRGAIFWSMAKRNSEGTLAYLEEAEAPYGAGKPYIYLATADKLEVAYGTDEADAPVANGALRGTFAEMNQAAIDDISAANENSLIYMLVSNQLRQIVGRTGNKIAANRAYVVYKALTTGEPNPAPGRRVATMSMQENVATGIDAMNADGTDAMKVIVNGQLFILRDGKTFDVTGREIIKK